MNKCLLIPILIFAAILPRLSNAQEVMSVDPFTGSVNGSIPLLKVRSKTLSYPIVASYYTNGLKVKSGAGNLGIGWNMSISPMISRKVNDLPDEFNENHNGQNFYGWLNGGAERVDSISNFLGEECHYDSFDDLNNLGGFGGVADIYDTQPDFYTVSVPGHLSFSFSFDTEGEVVINTQQDYLVTRDSASFRVIGPGNVTYLFQAINNTNYEFSGLEGNYFRKFFNGYNNLSTFPAHWSLVEIESNTGDKLYFKYAEPNRIRFNKNENLITIVFPEHVEEKELSAYTLNSFDDQYAKSYSLDVEKHYSMEAELYEISSELQVLDIRRAEGILAAGDYNVKTSQVNEISLSNIKTGAFLKGYFFDYVTIKSNEDPDTDSHIYLSEINQKSAFRMRSLFSFRYYGVNLEERSSLFTHRSSAQKDEFGFYAKKDDNTKLLRKIYCYPSLDNRSRFRTHPVHHLQDELIVLDGFESEAPDLRILQTGSLKQVKNNMGGSQYITYELNQYFDDLNETNRYGGGIRAKKTLLFDGISSNKNIVKNYTYEIDGKSSGRLMYQPTFATNLPVYIDSKDNKTYYYQQLIDSVELTENDVFRSMTLRSENDLSKEYDPGFYTSYETTIEQVEGVGKKKYEFSIFNDAKERTHANYSGTSLSRAIQASPIYETSCTAGNYLDYKDLLNHSLTYDYKWNGRLDTLTSYDALGEKISERITTYEVSGEADTIKGLRLQKYPQMITVDEVVFDGTTYYDHPIERDAFFYAKYEIPFGTSEVPVNIINRTFNGGEVIAGESNITYDSKLNVIDRSSINADGTEFFTKYSYASNYSSSGVPMSEGLKAFNIMNDYLKLGKTRIESYSGHRENGQEYVTAAQLSLWEKEGVGKAFPSKTLSFVSKDGVTNFHESEVYSVTGNSYLNYSSLYEKVQEVVERTSDNQVASVLSRGIAKSGTVFGSYGETKLTVSGAYSGEVIFSDFEGNNTQMWHLDNSAAIVDGRIVGNAAEIGIGDELLGTCLKGSDSYLLSFWYASDNTANLNIVINGDSPIVEPLVNTANEWQFKNLELDMSSVADDSLTISLTVDNNVKMDDVVTYPEHSTISNYLYEEGDKLISVGNEPSSFVKFEYDDFNIKTMTRNHEDEILQLSSYNTLSPSNIENQLVIDMSSDRFIDEPIQFGAIEFENATYQWKVVTQDVFEQDPADFSNATSTTIASHESTISTLGTHVIMVKMTFQGVELTANRKFEVIGRPIQVIICSNRPTVTDECNPNVFRSNCDLSTSSPDNIVALYANILNASESQYNYVWREHISTGQTNILKEDSIPINRPWVNLSSYQNKTYSVEVTGVGSAGTSPKIVFSTYKSDPTCGANAN